MPPSDRKQHMDDEDALVTAVDGRTLDVSIDLDAELVRLIIESATFVDLTPGGAQALAEQLSAAARAIYPE